MAVGRGGRSLMGPLLVINLVVYLIVLGLAGWSLNKYIDGEQNHPHLGGNPSTSFMLMFALIGGVMGASSMLAGFVHLRKWTCHTLATAASSAIISWSITVLAFGLQADNYGRSQRETSANFGSVDHHSYGESITLYTVAARWDLSQQVRPCLWFLWTSTLASSSQPSLLQL
ncbi:membrane protein PM19L-like isoform X2 [Solanum dulcamara]|uniref:membrane protein PM19L-like isoform X2 n=1 Tax=Solanum dulcamara TaxID=45834 RepID=UPI002485A261|nr:membrane protein PM19L-like isoform X2 [Solanum dulcamara]